MPLEVPSGTVFKQDVRQGDAMVDFPDSLALQLRREQDVIRDRFRIQMLWAVAAVAMPYAPIQVNRCPLHMQSRALRSSTKYHVPFSAGTLDTDSKTPQPLPARLGRCC